MPRTSPLTMVVVVIAMTSATFSPWVTKAPRYRLYRKSSCSAALSTISVGRVTGHVEPRQGVGQSRGVEAAQQRLADGARMQRFDVAAAHQPMTTTDRRIECAGQLG